MRLALAPPGLRKVIRDAVAAAEHHDDEAVAVLQRAGQALLAEAIAAGERGDALKLLAADALITYACERVAASEPQRLAGLQ